jgi:DNA-binding winged helix-turn-helix (wHTH) protein
MIYTFGHFELDLAAVELRSRGKAVSLEPQVFALLGLLVENRERLVSKDEIVEKVWDGRVVSDAAVASRVKSARQALGDDGKSQQFIRTIHGQGYRFVAQVKISRRCGCCGAARRRSAARSCRHGCAPGADLPAVAGGAAVSIRGQR